MRKHCQECHRPGTTAPFVLQTYEQAAAHANGMAEAVTAGRMPPWYASDDYGQFVNHRGLTAAERDTLVHWVRTGKAAGDLTKLPLTPPPEDPKWLIGKPDLVVAAPVHDIPAAGDVAYKYIVIPYSFPEETWVQRVQIRPNNPRVVHHCNMVYLTPGENYKQANFITGTVPGGSPMLLENGVAFRLPKGAKLLLQIHYVTTGKPEKCQIEVGFRYASGTVQKQLRHLLLVDNKFTIPPGAPAHEVKANKTLDCDALGVGLFVHMHVRGRDMTFLARTPDGKTEPLLLVPNYNFDWQMPYVWETGTKRFPKGTRLEAVAHYDNSAFNPYNPDPKAAVRDGLQTQQEMMNGFVFYTSADEDLRLDVDPATGQARSHGK
jgi:hypothetical protein